MAAECSHLVSVQFLEAPDEIEGCEECLQLGMRWVHLRLCQTCGHIGCCDSSEGRHATVHFKALGHPIVRSAEPGEDWSWCYVDQLMMRLAADRPPPAPHFPRQGSNAPARLPIGSQFSALSAENCERPWTPRHEFAVLRA